MKNMRTFEEFINENLNEATTEFDFDPTKDSKGSISIDVGEEFLNENIRLGKTDTLLDKMTINDFGDKWELNVVESDNELDPNSPNIGKEVYITLTGKNARDTTSDSIMIPKEQWEEFKKLINSIR